MVCGLKQPWSRPANCRSTARRPSASPARRRRAARCLPESRKSAAASSGVELARLQAARIVRPAARSFGGHPARPASSKLPTGGASLPPCSSPRGGRSPRAPGSTMSHGSPPCAYSLLGGCCIVSAKHADELAASLVCVFMFIVPSAPTTVTVLALARVAALDVQRLPRARLLVLARSRSEYLPGWPCVARSISPGSAPPMFWRMSRSARPIVRVRPPALAEAVESGVHVQLLRQRPVDDHPHGDRVGRRLYALEVELRARPPPRWPRSGPAGNPDRSPPSRR